MSDLDRANRRLRRASGMLGFMASVWLFCFWTVVLVVASFILWALFFS